MEYTAFRENLSSLMESRGYSSNKSLSDDLCVPAATISRWRTGDRAPDLEYVIRISEFFGVSIDWLLGFEQDRYSSLPADRQELFPAGRRGAGRRPPLPAGRPGPADSLEAVRQAGRAADPGKRGRHGPPGGKADRPLSGGFREGPLPDAGHLGVDCDGTGIYRSPLSSSPSPSGRAGPVQPPVRRQRSGERLRLPVLSCPGGAERRACLRSAFPVCRSADWPDDSLH